MVLPRVIIHNSVSLDSSLTGFEPNMELHYRIASGYRPDIHVIGSLTVQKGIELFGEGVPSEEPGDFMVPDRDTTLPLWVVIDSRGVLRGLLHICRRFEYCRDVMVLISARTPETYRAYLTERNYRYLITGIDRVDLKAALRILSESYGVKTVLTDTGRILGNAIINQGLANEISVLVHPVVVGEHSYPMFGDSLKNLKLHLKHAEVLEKEYVWIVYEVTG